MPKIVDHDAYREELLSGAYSLFAEQGYSAVTMREMARRLGVSTGTLYYYFSTKEEIFRSAVAFVVRRDVSLAMESVRKASSLRERFRLLVGFVRLQEKELRHFLLLVLEFQRQATTEEARTLLSDSLAFYREAITQQMGERGDERTSALMLSVFMGSLLQGLLDENAPELGEQAALLERLLVDSASMSDVALG